MNDKISNYLWICFSDLWARSEKYVNSVSVCEKRLFNKFNKIFKVTFK